MSIIGKHIRALKERPQDNVAVILSAAKAGELIETECDGTIEAIDCVGDIAAFHKIATQNIALGHAIIRRGTPIGVATNAIVKGELVHVHNIKSQRALIGAAQKSADQ